MIYRIDHKGYGNLQQKNTKSSIHELKLKYTNATEMSGKQKVIRKQQQNKGGSNEDSNEDLKGNEGGKRSEHTIMINSR